MCYSRGTYKESAGKELVREQSGRSDKSIFADAFNFYLYDGKPVICPEQLHELDTAELALPYGTDGAASPVQRFRDSLKELSAMEDGRAAYLLQSS